MLDKSIWGSTSFLRLYEHNGRQRESGREHETEGKRRMMCVFQMGGSGGLADGCENRQTGQRGRDE